MTFGPIVKDKKAIFVIPSELKLGSDSEQFIEQEIFTKEEYHTIIKRGWARDEKGVKAVRTRRPFFIVDFRK